MIYAAKKREVNVRASHASSSASRKGKREERHNRK